MQKSWVNIVIDYTDLFNYGADMFQRSWRLRGHHFCEENDYAYTNSELFYFLKMIMIKISTKSFVILYTVVKHSVNVL